jgi:membrane dipeptidase
MKSLMTLAVTAGVLAGTPGFCRPGVRHPRHSGQGHPQQGSLRARAAAWEKANPHPGGTIAEVADHIDHVRKVAGIDYVGIGADFFDAGTTSMVPALTDVTRYPYLFAELLRRGYSEEDLLKVAGRNHLRAMRQMEKAAERR